MSSSPIIHILLIIMVQKPFNLCSIDTLLSYSIIPSCSQPSPMNSPPCPVLSYLVLIYSIPSSSINYLIPSQPIFSVPTYLIPFPPILLRPNSVPFQPTLLRPNLFYSVLTYPTQFQRILLLLKLSYLVPTYRSPP